MRKEGREGREGRGRKGRKRRTRGGADEERREKWR